MDGATPTTRRPALALGGVLLGLLATGMIGCSQGLGTTAASMIRKVKESNDPNIRHAAYAKLAQPRVYDTEEQKVEAAKLLASKLADDKEPAASRAVICHTLGALKRPEGREVLLRSLRDPEEIVRAAACRALGHVGKPEDATMLARVMATDHSPDCQVAAIEGLGMLKSPDPRIEAVLIDGMESNSPAIRLASFNALCSTTGKDLGPNPKAWKDAAQARAKTESEPVKR